MLTARMADCRRLSPVLEDREVANQGDLRLVGNGRSLEVAVLLSYRGCRSRRWRTHDGARGAPLLRTSLFSSMEANHGMKRCRGRSDPGVQRQL